MFEQCIIKQKTKMFDKLLKPKYVFPTLFLASLIIFLLHSAYTKTAIFADARFYYMITRSIVKDFDIKFANEYAYFDMQPTFTNRDYVWNKYPPGSSFLWLPAFFWAEGFTNLLNTLNTLWGWIRIDTSGFGPIFQSAVAGTSIFLGILGLFLIYLLLQDYFPKRISLLTILALFGATNLLFYIAVEPINSHAASFFAASFFLYYFLRRQDDKYYYFVLGIIGRSSGLVRTQDLFILILPIIQGFVSLRKHLIKLARCYLLLATGALVSFAPQIYFWHKIFKTFWYSPYLEEGFNFKNPEILHVLFNTQNGLFSLTPIVGASIMGLFLQIFYSVKFESLEFRIFKRKQTIISLFSILYFTTQLFLTASWSSFYQGGSYSIRMLISTYPLLSFGLAWVVEGVSYKFGKKISEISIFLASTLNTIFILNYLLKY